MPGTRSYQEKSRFPATVSRVSCLRPSKHPPFNPPTRNPRHPLEDYLTTGAVTPFQYDRILKAIAERKNIVVCGGTGSERQRLPTRCCRKF